ncbi:hypothetical protein [Streptomyces clavuligerus]|uniref:Uncharacterized protein n=1 Tax=Streptomyces clavuligerus TaxID=1901 RepID=B5GST6_STRCL|nr:hypothetical protein [Streptomyces clavuligerus]ANW18433.1 hypothetical protein BB341_09400 [Streptomyces clavuligerus]AXU12988.1 hypothetical protein D1794_09730 [Streptomyces clavuligerus]EDY49382.1 hypothetical protein SSCG_02410 [Streptomyces clavuligerus]EFG08939.1 Hypothetical protein SCLAV_3867 [Streptomyces clavuligerus]MBY6302916.1 hypothetical protein [Streptomyces clavuligerus]
MESRQRPPWLPGCLTLLLGGLAGYGTDRISLAARRECSVVVREFISLFDWWFWQTPLAVIAGATAGLLSWALAAVAVRRAPRWVRAVVPAGFFLAVLTGLALWHFVWIGTPTNVAQDGAAPGCTSDNAPRWAPDWLPVGPPLILPPEG